MHMIFDKPLDAVFLKRKHNSKIILDENSAIRQWQVKGNDQKVL